MPYGNITTDLASYPITIEASDSQSGVNTNTINGNAIRVTGPNAFSKLASLISKTPATGNASVIIFDLSVAGPFSVSTNGVFEIRAVSGTIADVAGNAVSNVLLGTFECAIGVTPGDVVTYNGETVTYNGETVTYA